jgi:hypothetical protein
MALIDRIRRILGIEISPSGKEAVNAVSRSFTYDDAMDPDSKSRGSGSMDAEVGDPGTETWANLYPSIPDWEDDIPLKTYDAMRHGNGTVQAILRVLQLPILASRTSVVPGPEDKNGEVAKFIKECLTLGPHEGGMEIPLQKVIFEMTNSFWSGFKAQEIVYMERDGKVVVKKIAPRSCHSIKPVLDRHGNLVGAYQQSIFLSNNRMVFIPLEKTFWYAHRSENSNWYGESDLKAAYPHYENIRKLYIIDNKTHEVGAIPIRVAKPNIMTVSDTVKTAVFNKIKKIGLDTAVWIPKEIDLEFIQNNTAGSSASRSESIGHHTSQMAMSILAHFLQLGVNGQGTYNLSQDQSDFFLQMETQEMNDIANAINTQIVARLVKLNFGDNPGLCPTFQFADMTDHVRKTTEAIFLAIAQQGNRLSDEFIEALSQRVVSELGLDLGSLDANDESIPKASVDQKTLDDQAMAKFEAQAKASGAAKAGPGRGNASGGANQEVAKARKKVNMTAEEVLELAASSRNAKDLFGKVKMHYSNKSGVKAPATPSAVYDFLHIADLSNSGDIQAIVQMACDLVESVTEEE